MGVFDNFKEIDGEVKDTSWVEWWHFMVPNKENWLRRLMRSSLAKFGHCLECTVLDGCYFVKWNIPKNEISNTKGLLHPNCDCKVQNIDFTKVKYSAKADCDLTKFTNYIFGNDSKGKKELFETWGYTIKDSENLVNEFCEQALNNYLKGNYTLKKLDKYGQRLAIPVTLNSKYSFNSGWMLHPEGLMVNITPFGGRIK